MTYDANEIARYVIDRCCNRNRPVTNLKLQKILYLLWLDYYRETGRNLYDNRVEAWEFGPVVPDTYYLYRIYAAGRIRDVPPCDDLQPNRAIKDTDREILDRTIYRCMKRSLGDLIDDTRRPGGAWDRVQRMHGLHARIDRSEMMKEADQKGS